MTTETKSHAAWLETFERLEKELGRDGREWLAERRRTAIERFAELGFPTTRDETWRFTPVTAIARTPFAPALAPGAAATAEIERLGGVVDGALAVFVDGHLAPELSRLAGLPGGVEVASLAAVVGAPDRRAAIETTLGRAADLDDRHFVTLNTAFFADGAFVHVRRGVAVERPIHLLFLSTGADSASSSHPRNLVIVDESAEVRLVETHAGAEGDVYFANPVTECHLGENATLDHTKLQLESQAAFHVGQLAARQERASRFISRSLSIGGRLVRQDIDVVQAAEGIECQLDGLFVAAGDQHVDHHTTVDHALPHGTSRELYKGILDGAATGVFNGRVLVRPDAQKTDSGQINRNLLLSPDAVIETKPELEIFADDVKCAHGATIGQLEENAMFYLRSRGIAAADARTLLIRAFASEVIDRLPIEGLRTHLTQLLARRLPGAPEGERP